MALKSESPSSASTESSVDEYTLMMEELKELFYYSPPSLAKPSNWTPSIPPAPFWLYDKHLDEKLILRHVRPMKSLKRDISGTVDRILNSIQAGEVDLPPIGPRSSFTDRDNSLEAVAHDANSLANFYGATTAFYCHPVASTLAIHPQSPDWITSLAWRHTGELGPPGFDSEGYAIRFRSRDGKTLQLDPTVRQCLDKDAVEGLTSMSRKFPVMATWEISDASNRSEEVLREMDLLLESDSFRPTLCRTTGHLPTSSKIHQPLDALSTPWKIPDSPRDFSSTQRSSSRPKKATARAAAPTRLFIKSNSQPDKKITYVEQTTIPSNELRENDQKSIGVSPANHLPLSHCPTVAELLIQHAWTRSVREDTSIIVFYCGDFERIGVRHRKSQTLYLSPLIDAAHDKLPAAYGKIHVGLFIAAYQDTRDRFEQLQALGIDKLPRRVPQPMKRHVADENSIKKRTRRRLHPSDDVPDAPLLDTQEVLREAGLRHLALVRLEYEVFNSQTPGSFLRIGRSLAPRVGPRHPPRARKKYLTHEYMTLVVGPIIGNGATGITHNAKIEITTLDNRDMEHEVVVKFAFSDEQHERMQHEYSIYDHMASAGIRNGVPEVYGLFKDMEGNTMALVMSHAGTSMWDRRPNTEDVTVTAKPDERSTFLQIMKNIHAAGVRHQDIRSPNLLIDDAGNATILDFDRADLNSSLGARSREYARLVHLLDGGWLPSVLGIPSDPTISEKNSASDGSNAGASTPRNSEK